MKRFGAALLLAFIATLTTPRPTPAASVPETLSAVRTKVEQGEFLDALEELRSAEFDIWKAMPSMVLRKAVLVTGEPSFSGSYLPRGSNRYAPNEPVQLYVEPAGYTIVEEKSGYRFALTADFTLVDSEGRILGGQREFHRWELTARRPVTGYWMYLTFEFSDLKAGTYNIETVFRDLNSDRTLEFVTPFVVVE